MVHAAETVAAEKAMDLELATTLQRAEPAEIRTLVVDGAVTARQALEALATRQYVFVGGVVERSHYEPLLPLTNLDPTSPSALTEYYPMAQQEGVRASKVIGQALFSAATGDCNRPNEAWMDGHKGPTEELPQFLGWYYDTGSQAYIYQLDRRLDNTLRVWPPQGFIHLLRDDGSFQQLEGTHEPGSLISFNPGGHDTVATIPYGDGLDEFAFAPPAVQISAPPAVARLVLKGEVGR